MMWCGQSEEQVGPDESPLCDLGAPSIIHPYSSLDMNTEPQPEYSQRNQHTRRFSHSVLIVLTVPSSIACITQRV